MKPEKVELIHPEGKKLPRMARDKYDVLRLHILDILRTQGPVGFTECLHEVERRLEGKFEGKVAWHYVSVKLDMEARGELVRLPGSGPQMMALGEVR